MAVTAIKHDEDVEIIQRYTNQPAAMPDTIKSHIENLWNGDPIQLYALADLSSTLSLTNRWVALGADELVIYQGDNENSAAKPTRVIVSDIKMIEEKPGLSCTILNILGEPDEPALAVIRYSHRQRQSMENIKFVLNQRLNGRNLSADNADTAYSSAVAESVRKAQASIARNRLTVVWRLLTYLYPYRTQVTFGVIAAVLITALTLTAPIITKYIIDDVYQPYRDGLTRYEQAVNSGIWIIATLAVIYLLRELFHWIRLRTMSMIGEYVARDLRRELYTHLQRLSVSFYSSKQTGGLISRVSHDTDRLWDFIAFGIVEVSLSFIMLVGLSVVLISLDWRLGLLLTLPVPVLLWSFFIHSKTLQNLFIRAWRKWSTLTEVLSDTIPGIRVVKAFNQESNEIDRFNERNNVCLDEFNEIHKVWTKFWPRLLLALHAMVITVWIFALPRLLNGADNDTASLTVGTFFAFLLYMGMFFQPIETIGIMTRMLNRATSSAVRIFEILDTEPELAQPKKAVRLTPLKGEVTFDNVSFAYDSIRQVLKSVSFSVKPGEMIGLVGPSGAGKTSVINLIAHFYAPSAGKILIDGEDILELDIGHYRRQVGMVLQDPHLFHGTVLDNIRYGMQEASLQQIIDAAQAANAHDFICKLPYGYETTVGERGHTLSGGERQRISIARAILCDPRILILDEATSSVDTETERKIQQALERLVEGRTVFAIAHRLSTLRKADRLFVMEDGKLVEVGTHSELLQKPDGIYRKLSDMQKEMHEIFAV